MHTARIHAREQGQAQRPPDSRSGGPSAPAAGPDPAVFDRAGTLQRMGQDLPLLRLILHHFVGDVPLQIQALRDFLRTGDAWGVERKSHAIRGASDTVGATALRTAAFAVEALAKAGDLRAAGDRVEGIETAFQHFVDVLCDWGYLS